MDQLWGLQLELFDWHLITLCTSLLQLRIKVTSNFTKKYKKKNWKILFHIIKMSPYTSVIYEILDDNLTWQVFWMESNIKILLYWNFIFFLSIFIFIILTNWCDMFFLCSTYFLKQIYIIWHRMTYIIQMFSFCIYLLYDIFAGIPEYGWFGIKFVLVIIN